MAVVEIRLEFAPDQRLLIARILSQLTQLLIIIEDGIRIVLLSRQIQLAVVRIDLQPRSPGRKSRIFRSIPLERRTCVVAAVFLDIFQRLFRRNAGCNRHVVIVDRGNVVHLVDAHERAIFHTDLLPFVDPRKTLHKEIQRRKHLFRNRIHFAGRNIAAHTARLVVVFDNIGNECSPVDLLLRGKYAVSVSIRRDVLIFMPAAGSAAPNGFRKIEHRREITFVPDKVGELIIRDVEHFSNCKCVMRLERPVPHFPEENADAFRLVQLQMDVAQAVFAVSRIIFKRKSLFDIDDRVDTEAGQAAVEPPVDHFVDFLADFRVLPVEIRLLFVEDMEIDIVVISRKIIPRRTSEIGAPV